jgi:hypothetical protein
MNDNFHNLRKFNGIDILSEEEKNRILSMNNSNFLKVKIDADANLVSRVPDYFINNIFAKSIIENYLRNCPTRDNYEFHKKGFDKYFVNYSDREEYPCILHDKANKAYSFFDEISDHNVTTFKNSYFGVEIEILPEFKEDKFHYSDALFSVIMNYYPKESVIDEVNKMFEMAIGCFDGDKVLSTHTFEKVFDLIKNLIGHSYRWSFGHKGQEFISSHKNIRNAFDLLSSKMIYFDISDNYDRSESLKAFAKICYEMVRDFSCSPNGGTRNSILFKKLISCRNIFRGYKPINYSIVNDSVISVVVELAFIYAEKNNLDLIKKEILEDIFLAKGTFTSEYTGSFKHAVIYSHSTRNRSMLDFVLSPKHLKKMYYFNRKVLYSAAIISGNLNDNLISRLSAERCIIDDYTSEALMISRFLYKDSKILRKMSSILWRSNNYQLLILFISFLEKNDIHILMSLNVDRDSLYPSEFDLYQRIIKIKIDKLELEV